MLCSLLTSSIQLPNEMEDNLLVMLMNSTFKLDCGRSTYTPRNTLYLLYSLYYVNPFKGQWMHSFFPAVL